MSRHNGQRRAALHPGPPWRHILYRGCRPTTWERVGLLIMVDTYRRAWMTIGLWLLLCPMPPARLLSQSNYRPSWMFLSFVWVYWWPMTSEAFVSCNVWKRRTTSNMSLSASYMKCQKEYILAYLAAVGTPCGSSEKQLAYLFIIDASTTESQIHFVSWRLPSTTF